MDLGSEQPEKQISKNSRRGERGTNIVELLWANTLVPTSVTYKSYSRWLFFQRSLKTPCITDLQRFTGVFWGDARECGVSQNGRGATFHHKMLFPNCMYTYLFRLTTCKIGFLLTQLSSYSSLPYRFIVLYISIHTTDSPIKHISTNREHPYMHSVTVFLRLHPYPNLSADSPTAITCSVSPSQIHRSYIYKDSPYPFPTPQIKSVQNLQIFSVKKKN